MEHGQQDHLLERAQHAGLSHGHTSPPKINLQSR
jgi:hypothetical protein